MEKNNIIRLALQKAFIGNIGYDFRGICFSYNNEKQEFKIQIFLNDKPSDENKELVSAALTEFEAMCPFISSINEEYIFSKESISDLKTLEDIFFWRNELPIY